MASALGMDEQIIPSDVYQLRSQISESALIRDGKFVITVARAARYCRMNVQKFRTLVAAKQQLSSYTSFAPHLVKAGYSYDEIHGSVVKDSVYYRFDAEQVACLMLLTYRFFHFPELESFCRSVIANAGGYDKLACLTAQGLEAIATVLRPPRSRVKPTTIQVESVDKDGLAVPKTRCNRLKNMKLAPIIESDETPLDDVFSEATTDNGSGSTSKGGYVYVINSVGTDFYKIGKTIDISRRFNVIHYSQPLGARLIKLIDVNSFLEINGPIPGIGFHPTRTKIEEYLHVKFHSQRLNGEWFQLTPEMLLDTFEWSDIARAIVDKQNKTYDYPDQILRS